MVNTLIQLFDALAALDHSTGTTLWTFEYPLAEEALRLWTASRGRTIDESKCEAGHALTVYRDNHSAIVTVRLDDLHAGPHRFTRDDEVQP